MGPVFPSEWQGHRNVERTFILCSLLFRRGDPSLVKLNVAITCGYLLYGELVLFLFMLIIPSNKQRKRALTRL